ncbi:putative Zn-dependent protease with MMP-like domain [Friedmanniella endophytica]|uniref:Putative Zn-dependent protease with MMP-like domain n=1 Tax=Microlunatus kandeliicorticis TaxID=1759536 RepID=A0A7W3INV9_9ACTN|nr:metallopeptidase family protein [Microlunatus kandeliicorticis]MBA8792500.1 putative Zn-dependent protease with MMP-like domain [Microlunatus kandeliicorticis]
MSLDLAPEQFDALVDRALDQIPPEFAEQVGTCVVLIEDEPPAEDPDLLGLYKGVPITERGANDGGLLPDRIYIFRNPLLERCQDIDELVDEIRITVVHEVGHAFGLDDDRLHELGYA